MNNSRLSSFLLLALLLSCAGSTVMAMDKTKKTVDPDDGQKITYRLLLKALNEQKKDTKEILKIVKEKKDKSRINAYRQGYKKDLNYNSDLRNLQVALGFLAATEIANYANKVAIAKGLLGEDSPIHELVHKLKRASRTNTVAKSLLTIGGAKILGGSDVLERGSLKNSFVESGGCMTNYVIIEYLGGYLGKFSWIQKVSNTVPDEAKHVIKALASQTAWVGEKLFISWLFGPAKSNRKQ